MIDAFAALGVSGVAIVATVFGVVVWHLSGVPLNEYRGECDSAQPKPDLDVREVLITGPLGQYPAWYVNGGKNARVWALMLHGRGGDVSSWANTLPLLHKAGITSLSVSHRNDPGAPASPDGLDHLGTTEWQDIDAAARWARNRGAQKFVIIARSAGAAVAMQFLKRSPFGDLVTDMILEDPVLNWHEVFMSCRPSWMPRGMAKLILKVSAARVGLRWDHLNVLRWPPVRRPRLLLMHTDIDTVVPYSISREFFSELKSEWPMVLLGGAWTHGHAREDDPEWHDLVVSTWLGVEPNDFLPVGTLR